MYIILYKIIYPTPPLEIDQSPYSPHTKIFYFLFFELMFHAVFIQCFTPFPKSFQLRFSPWIIPLKAGIAKGLILVIKPMPPFIQVLHIYGSWHRVWIATMFVWLKCKCAIWKQIQTAQTPFNRNYGIRIIPTTWESVYQRVLSLTALNESY